MKFSRTAASSWLCNDSSRSESDAVVSVLEQYGEEEEEGDEGDDDDDILC